MIDCRAVASPFKSLSKSSVSAQVCASALFAVALNLLGACAVFGKAWVPLHVVSCERVAADELQTDESAKQVARVLEIDAVLSKQRNLFSQSVSLDTTVSAYLLGLDAIEFSKCPKNFHDAFLAHRRAWERALPFLKKHSSLRGEMHELFDQIKAASLEDKAELKRIVDDVQQTWQQVEMASNAGSTVSDTKGSQGSSIAMGEETYEYLTPDRLDDAAHGRLVTARRQVWEAWFAGDTERLKELCPSETVTGDTTNSDWLRLPRVLDDSKSFAAGGAVLESLVFDRNLVQLYGNVAILYVNFHGETKSGDKSTRMSGSAVEVLVMRNNQWLNSGWYLRFDSE